SKRQAQAEAARLVTELKNGTAVDPSRMTVAAFLERWIEHMQGQVSPRSHERYTELCRKNLAPLLGGLALSKLQPGRSPAAAGTVQAGFPRGRLTTCTACCGERFSRRCAGSCSRATPPTPSSR